MTAYDIARRYLGTKERPGTQHNPHIVAWLEDAGLGRNTADETPWCAVFVRHVAWLTGIPVPRLPARARSWLTVGEPIALADAVPGWDIVILKRGTGDQPGPETLSAPGHVGFFAGRTGDSVLLLGGNQVNSVSVQPFPVSRVLGVRRLHR